MLDGTETKPDTREEMPNCSGTHEGTGNKGGCRCAPEAAATPLLLDVAEVARLLTCSKPHVRRLADAGRMPRPVKLGTLVRWKRAEIEQWLTAGCPDARRSALG